MASTRRPLKEFEHDEKIIREQSEAGVLQETKLAWVSPVVFVRKKDRSSQPRVDYRKLNDVTRKDAYPLPRIDDCLDSVSGARMFSTIDLQLGYWQIEVKESNRDKTAVVTLSRLCRLGVAVPRNFSALYGTRIAWPTMKNFVSLFGLYYSV